MSKAKLVKTVGRPQKYTGRTIRAIKAVVRLHGLIAGRKVLLSEGVVVNGKPLKITISLPTLAKYVKSDEGGTTPVKLTRGGDRRSDKAKAAREVLVA